jgi:hypothetical protein
MTDRYVCGFMYQDVRRLQYWVREEAELQFRLGRWIQGIGIIVQIEFTL